MKLTTSFQIKPEIDIYTPIKIELGGDKSTTEILTKEDYIIHLNMSNDPNKEAIQSKATTEIERKIEYYCLCNQWVSDDDWRELVITRLPISMMTNYTDEVIESDVPVINIKTAMFLPKMRKRKNKVILVSKGVIFFRHLYCQFDMTLPYCIYNTLKDMGIIVDFTGNDFEINGKKFFGFVNEELEDKKFYSEAILTFEYDDKVFSSLPAKYYSRSYIEGKPEGQPGITGLLNEYPNLDINEFLKRLLVYLGY